MDEAKCPLCGLEAGKHAKVLVNPDGFDVDCKRCGEFRLGNVAWRNLKDTPRRHVFSGLTRQATERDDPHLVISNKNRDDLEKLAPVTVQAKVETLLQAIARKSDHPGKQVSFWYDLDYPLAFCANEDEFVFYLNSLEGRDFIDEVEVPVGDDELPYGNYACVLTARGWEEVEALKTSGRQSDKCFVAMAFKPALKPTYLEAILPAIGDCGYKPIRLDFEEHVDRVDDRIIGDIRESRFMVADFTGHRRGVYFEAGFALGLGHTVIWTCRKDHVKGLHFDIRQYNHIEWETHEQLRERLTDRIRAVIGRGPHSPESE